MNSVEKQKKVFEDYVLESEALEITGYKRTAFYLFRKKGLVRWVAAASGRKIRYHRGDLLKLLGL